MRTFADKKGKYTNLTPIKKKVSRHKVFTITAINKPEAVETLKFPSFEEIMKANVRKQKRATEIPRVKKPPLPPSLDELIAECRAVGWTDMAKSMERLRYLESPRGQRALERRERRLSRL